MEHDETAVLEATLVTLFLFAAHHAYGAIRYATPWRMHGALVALAIALVLLAGFRALRGRAPGPAGRAAWALLAGLAIVTSVLGVGLFEGLYNHVLKDALFLGGASRELLLRMFPPPGYQLPDDVWFELSGVLQVLPAAWTAREALRLARPGPERVTP